MIVHRPPVVHSPSHIKVVLISGLSDPSDCALSRSQQLFLDQLPVPADGKINANFPYHVPVRSEQAAVPLLLASWRNLSQFLGASRTPYREFAVSHWEALSKSCHGLLVITISCGLEILNSCLSSGIRPLHLEILALGPVAWRRPTVPHTLVRGSGDFVLNPFFRDSDVILPHVGHLDYLESPLVIEMARERLTRLSQLIEPSPSAYA